MENIIDNEELNLLDERYKLSRERIKEITTEDTVDEKYRPYFKEVAKFLSFVNDLANDLTDESFSANEKNLKDINETLYSNLYESNYKNSYCNPDYSNCQFGQDLGKLLSYLYAELRSTIAFAYEKRIEELTIYLELFIQIYNLFESDDEVNIAELRDILYWFNFDYTDLFMERLVEEQYNPTKTFAKDIIMKSDLTDLSYLYKYGEYISDNEIKIAKYLNKQPAYKIKAMADTMTEGYRIGFATTGKDISTRKYCSIHYAIGFERMMREVIKNLEELGLTVLCFRAPLQSISRNRLNSNGFYSSSPNKQYDYDHKDDIALFYDNNFAERKLDELRKAYEANKEYMNLYAGPAVLETFGENPFLPLEKESAFHLDEKQQKTRVSFTSKSRQLLTEYVDFTQRSFTIIAYPTVQIHEKFEEVFDEIIKINTLDYELYSKVQQTIIDTLDNAEYVEIIGNNGNETNLRVSLCDIKDSSKETKFENCVADVNIPVGEVFTSPKLAGTDGTLHVSSVYLNGLRFENLKLSFENGMIKSYECKNFKETDKNLKYIRENVLFNHDSLPMGEFAIGTNTTAYVMANKYDINDKMPILIAEKMGPHFAVGDTCYSLCEDIVVHNPNGKEIICRDNEITAKYRKNDMSKAYFNCHTDITIPYSELGSIIAYDKANNGTTIIANGRFVLPGCEILNKAFEQ